jgi:hypothetical protein
MSELMWVAVPGGTSGQSATDQATLRILITPKLDDGTLAGHGLDQWPPPSLVGGQLAVDFANAVGGDVTTVTVNPPHIQAQSGLWQTFFAASMAVTAPPGRGAAPPQVVVDSTSENADAMDATFSTVATTDVGGSQTPMSALNQVARNQLLAHWSAPAPMPPPVTPPTTPPPPFVPPDFHRTIALLREHPAVLRALGLIIEIKLPFTALPSVLPTGVVRVRWPQAPAALPPITSPWTRYSDQFLPGTTSPTSNTDNGMVTLTNAPNAPPAGGTPRWATVTVDVDNGARRLKDAAAAMSAAPSGAAAADGKTFLLPALRSNGIALVKRDRQSDFAQRRQAADAFATHALDQMEVTADDLVLGYRVDVKLEGRDWQSLNVRSVQYSVTRDGTKVDIAAPATEEGHIKAHAAVDDGGGSGQLRADEVVARWDGWSLAVPRPDLAAPAGGAAPAINPAMPYQFRWTFGVQDGSLPRLRFARTYRMRARVADMAGGGLDVTDPRADRCFTDTVTYRRYEPVSSPALALPAGFTAFSPGEAADRVVIRSDVNAPVTSFTNNLTRVITVPRTSLTLVEQHGALDAMTPPQIRDLVLHELASAGPNAMADEVLFPDFAADGVCVFPRPDPGSPNVQQTERAWIEPWPDYKPKQIVLQERTASSSPVLEWQTAAQIGDPTIGDRLIVRLAKGEELTLEISSFPKSDFADHLAVSASTLPKTSADVINAGRHPMVSPARTVTLTHAVRRPLGTPAGTLAARREENQTFAMLDPSPALLGLDANSTAKLEVTASWTDPGATPVTDAPVQSVIVSRGDLALRDQIRHEFGDTRHRMVTYALTALSRFRPYFTDTDPSLFSIRTVLSDPVNVPNSARPAPPVIVSVRPAFAWQETRVDSPAFQLQRRRLPGRLRIELQGSWFQTGEGELLALLFAKTSIPPDGMDAFVTRVGGDPITHSVNIPHLFPLATNAAGDLPARDVTLPEAPGPVVAVPFKPWRGDTGWFADIALPGLADPGMSSWPFVEMAVARYQPDSLVGLDLSKVVKAEIGQVLPERILDVRRSGNDVFVSLHGDADSATSEFGVVNAFTVVLEHLQAPAGTLPDAVELTALAPPSDPPVMVPPTTDGLPAWVAVDNQLHRGTIGGIGLHELQIAIPAGLAGPLRLRIRESEDDDAAPPLLADDDGELTARTVYSDIVMLP